MEKRLAFMVAFIVFIGCLGQAPTPTQTPSPTTTPAPVNSVVKYATEKGLSGDIAQILAPLGSDGLQDSDRQAVDAVAALPYLTRNYAASRIMTDGRIEPIEIDILKASADNADASPHVWDMSFMNSFDEKALNYIQFLNDIWSNNPGLAEKIMSDKRLSGYETTLLNVYEKDPAYTRKVAKTELLIRDGKLTPAEEAFLLNPSSTSEAKVREELLNPYKSPVLDEIKDMPLEVLDDITYALPQDRLEYETAQGHMDADDFTGLGNLLAIYEPDGYAAYALFALSGAPEMQDGINSTEKNIIETEIIPGSMKLDGSLPEILNPLGGPILWNIAKSSVDVSKYPKIVYGLTLSHEPLMEIADPRISEFVLDQTLQKAKFGIENDRRISWNLEDIPFEAVSSWAFLPMMEYGDYHFETGEEFTKLKKSITITLYIYPKVKDLENYKKIALKFVKPAMKDTYNEIMDKNYSWQGSDKPWFHYRRETVVDDKFKLAEEMINEFQKNGFVRGDCTQNSFWIGLLSNSIGIPSQKYLQWFSKKNSDLNTGIFTGENYLYYGNYYGDNITYVSPAIIEFDSEGNIVESPVLSVDNIFSVPSSWFENQTYQAWKKRWKK